MRQKAEMLAESVEALAERRSMGYLLARVQRDPAVMCFRE